jgi:hypothetical protein
MTHSRDDSTELDRVDDSALHISVEEGGQDYRWAVMRRLIEQRMLLGSINRHLEEVNGTVATHAKAIEEMKILHAQREKYCPLVASIEGQVLSLRLDVAAVAAQQREASAIKSERAGIWKLVAPWVHPLIVAFIAALIALIAAHVNDVFRRPAG